MVAGLFGKAQRRELHSLEDTEYKKPFKLLRIVTPKVVFFYIFQGGVRPYVEVFDLTSKLFIHLHGLCPQKRA
jgi:hypothetical protein